MANSVGPDETATLVGLHVCSHLSVPTLRILTVVQGYSLPFYNSTFVKKFQIDSLSTDANVKSEWYSLRQGSRVKCMCIQT